MLTSTRPAVVQINLVLIRPAKMVTPRIKPTTPARERKIRMNEDMRRNCQFYLANDASVRRLLVTENTPDTPLAAKYASCLSISLLTMPSKVTCPRLTIMWIEEGFVPTPYRLRPPLRKIARNVRTRIESSNDESGKTSMLLITRLTPAILATLACRVDCSLLAALTCPYNVTVSPSILLFEIIEHSIKRERHECLWDFLRQQWITNSLLVILRLRGRE